LQHYLKQFAQEGIAKVPHMDVCVCSKQLVALSWECWMSACWPEGQNNRHILCPQRVGRHVGQHVGKMSKKHVGPGPLMLADMSLADMLADMSAI
jgi:hypothetical protein